MVNEESKSIYEPDLFKRINSEMIATNERAWNSKYGGARSNNVRNYSLEEVNEIINSSNLAEQQRLSRNYYDKNGFYKRIILYYATLLTYSGLLIPNPRFGKKLSDTHVAKKYYQALEYIDKIDLVEIMTRMSLRALIDGSYYGIIQTLNKDSFVIFDLPASYCRSNFKDIYGNDIVEFDIRYFSKITDPQMLQEALDTFPKIISSFYKKYLKGKTTSSWVKLPTDVGICIPFFDDGRPLFLSTIPATIQYDDAVNTERERELEEIRKIIVQKIPHLNDGQLLFEPEEASEMHAGAVGMMKSNKNLSVLTTYADVEAIMSKTANDNASSSLEKMQQNVYSDAGVTSQLFAPTGTQAIPYSINNDMALMMILGTKYSRFFTNILNNLFSNSNVSFQYKILELTHYNKSEFISDSLKLAQSGYSFLLPAIASGINQRELTSLKSLENDVLKLGDILTPLSSSFTQSSNSGEGAGRPEKKLEEKSQKTIQNEDAINNQGGSNE